MRKGKLKADFNAFDCHIENYHEVYELVIDGITLYVDKKYKEVLTPPGMDTPQVTNIHDGVCHFYTHSSYMEELATHFGEEDAIANITWIEPLTDVA